MLCPICGSPYVSDIRQEKVETWFCTVCGTIFSIDKRGKK